MERLMAAAIALRIADFLSAAIGAAIVTVKERFWLGDPGRIAR